MDREEAKQAYRDLRISKGVFFASVGDTHNRNSECPLSLDRKHVVRALEMYRGGRITAAQLVDWANIIWFSDFYDYEVGHDEEIARVMNVLEELDERETMELSNAEIDDLIDVLESKAEE